MDGDLSIKFFLELALAHWLLYMGKLQREPRIQPEHSVISLFTCSAADSSFSPFVDQNCEEPHGHKKQDKNVQQQLNQITLKGECFIGI